MTDLELTPEATAQPYSPPRTLSGEIKALLVLGLPMALTQMIQFSIYTVDTIMVGRLGTLELGAAALGTVLYFLFWMIGAGPVMAISPLVSQALGANQNETRDIRMSVRMALWCIAIMWPLLFIIISFAEPLLLFFGQDAELAKLAGQYVFALAFGWPFALAIMGLRNFLAAIDKTTIPLLLVIIKVGLNIVLNALLIFGLWGAPKLGLIGAGIASSLSYAIGFFMFVVYIGLDKDARRFHLFENWWRPHWRRLKDVIQLGWPISVTTIFEGMLFNMCVLIMGAIGTMEVAAYQIALNVSAFAFMFPFGLSMAGAVRAGLAKGAENRRAVQRAGIATVLVCVIGMLIFAVPIAFKPESVTRIYLSVTDPNNADVIALVILFLPIAGAFMLFDATQVAANQLLRGLKDVKIPMIMTGISYWVVGFPIAYYLGLKTDVGAVGIWYGLLAGLVMASILLGARFWHLAWGRPAQTET